MAGRTPTSLIDRLDEKIQTGPDCWLWTANKNNHGYGLIRSGKHKRLAHRIVYELLIGPIPTGLVLDHLCRVPLCVNPAHLEPVTFAENVRRGTAGQGGRERQLSKTHCPQGHPYSEENTYVHKRSPGRGCITCRTVASKKYLARKKEQHESASNSR